MNLCRRQVIGTAVSWPLLTLLAFAGEPDIDSEIPWLNEVQRPSMPLPGDVPTLSPLLVDEQGQPITTLDGWMARRQALRRDWLEFLGAWEAPPTRNDLEILASEEFDGLLRQLVRYECEPGEQVEAYLVRPARIERPIPGVVAFHSTANQTIRQPAGLAGKPEEAWGPLLARSGFAVLCPRCFLWNSTGPIDTKSTVAALSERHPGAKGMAKMLYDAGRAVDVLAAQECVDAARLGAVGHSLGAKEVLYLAALDERIKVAVSSEGGIGTRFSNWHDPWYLTDAIQQPDFQREHHELLALAAPRAFLLLGGDSADGARSWPFIEAVLPIYDLYGKPRRVGLLNHKQGHTIPPIAVERTLEWFERYLK